MDGEDNEENPRENRSRTRSRQHVIGPQSALTDFLASHNISANQIRREADQRRQAAARSQQENGSSATPSAQITAPAEAGPSNSNSDPATQDTKRKKETQKAIDKIKASKSFKKRKRRYSDSEDSDSIARAIFEETRAPLPGQMENCDICEKRFTVTPYSRTGPSGGLLCTPCGKELDKEDGPAKRKPRKSTAGAGRRRKLQSSILDGTYHVGAKNLTTLCIETLAKNVDLADSLGDLPDHLIDKIARLFSKRRLLTPQTLPLFAQPSTEILKIYDGAKISSDNLIGIFQMAQQLRQVKIRNAIQFKDEVMEYFLTRDINLESISLHGANLLSEENWEKFLTKRGASLKALKVYYTDRHFGDETILLLKKSCPQLERLKISNNQKVTNDGVKNVANLKTLKHLSLHLQQKTTSRSYCLTIGKIGKDLQTLSLKNVPEVNDDLLSCIHKNCRSLKKLRITDSEHMTDEGFVGLFEDWENPPLHVIDFQKCRHMDSQSARVNEDNIGLCSDGFLALMKHSGKGLRELNIHACRHISQEAFEEAFSENKIYPELLKMEISFCEYVTDFIVGCIFRSCPALRELNVFGCMKVKGARVPRGKILVGVPNAVGMVIEGWED